MAVTILKAAAKGTAKKAAGKQAKKAVTARAKGKGKAAKAAPAPRQPVSLPSVGGKDQKFISVLVLIVLVAVYLGYSDRIKAAWSTVRGGKAAAPGTIPTLPSIPPIGSTPASVPGAKPAASTAPVTPPKIGPQLPTNGGAKK